MRRLLGSSVLALLAACATIGCATTETDVRGGDRRDRYAERDDRDDRGRDDRGDRGDRGDGEEVDILRERVTRLERRLSDVDAKLGLLLAQRSSPSAPSRGAVARGRDPSLDAPGYRQQPREEASLGAHTIDLGPRARPGDEDAAPQYVEDAPSGGRDDQPVVIKIDGRGDPRSADMSGRGTDGDRAQISSGPQLSMGASVDEVYQYGMQRLKAKAYLEAIAAFEDIVERAPQHDLADNAMYWTGQCHAERGDHRVALDVWQRLPVRYPKSPKVPDALYGMAQSHEAVGEPALAETLYLELVTHYPKAEKVRDAQKALKRLRPQ
jgi:tol-pal system protein YbgF